MPEFIRHHLEIVREKGHEWQIKVAWKTIALVAALSFAAHTTYQKSFDRKGLAQLAVKGSLATKDAPVGRTPAASRTPRNMNIDR
jgi:hypothetical protein